MSTSLKHYDFLISRIKDYIFLSNKEAELVNSLFTEEHFKNNEVIASHIGVTPQALCRIKKKLLDRNL